MLGCGGTVATTEDAGSDAGTVRKDAASATDAADVFIPTTLLDGHTVNSPNGTILGGVKVCVFKHPEMPCVTSDSSGAFTIDLPSNAETGVTLEKTGYASVLAPLAVATDTLTYTIGVPTEQSRKQLYGAFGATYPDTAHGFVFFIGTLKGQQELGLDGVTGSIDPATGVGPFYVDTGGAAAPSATSTSTYSAIYFASLAPSDSSVVKLAPTSMSCAQYFGGWTTSQLNAARFPVAAGFETHVGLICKK